MESAHVREFKIVLDSGFHTVDSELQELAWIPVFVSGTWIPIFSRISDSLSCIPDSKAHDSEFYKELFPGFRIPYMGDRPSLGVPIVLFWLYTDKIPTGILSTESLISMCNQMVNL